MIVTGPAPTAAATAARRSHAFGPRTATNRLFPDAFLPSPADASAFGPNATSDGPNATTDGHNVVLPQNATDPAGRLRERGFRPVGVDRAELLKAGGSVKRRTLELRRDA